MGILYVDLSKAFNTAPWAIQLKKHRLGRMNVQGVHNCLSDPKQRVTITGWMSACQGSSGGILHPLLFGVFINDSVFTLMITKLPYCGANSLTPHCLRC